MMPREICACAVCREPLFEGDTLAEHPVYDFASRLKYIELAHAECGDRDNEKFPQYWQVDPPM